MSLIISRDFVLQTEAPAAPVVDRFPAIGWQNLYLLGDVTSGDADPGFPPQLAIDGFTSTAWRSTSATIHWIRVDLDMARPADYAAIAAHTLEGCTVVPQYHDGTFFQPLTEPILVTSNAPIVWNFDERASDKWRLLVSHSPEPTIAVGAVHIGKATRPDIGLPVGWAPPSLNEDVEYSSPVSVRGQLLPRHVRRRGAEATVQLTAMEYAFARGEWAQFLEFAHGRAFFLWWVFEGRAEVIYGGLERFGGSFARSMTADLTLTMRGITR